MTFPYAEVIGDPISHSKSPLIHKFWLEKLGLEGDYRAVHIRAEELGAYFSERREDKVWRGCNITSPHKIAAMEHVALLGPVRETIGAINTVFRHTFDIAMGTNTDGLGVALAIKSHVARHPAMQPFTMAVQLIGAGGAARGAVAGLKELGCTDFHFYNRTVDHARALALQFGIEAERARGLDSLRPLAPEERPPWSQGDHLVINLSKMGMVGEPPVPIDLTAYPPGTLVFDAVYAPLETPLLRSAAELGMAHVDGLSMLIEQADAAFTAFFRAKPPRAHDSKLRQLLTS